MKRLLSIAFLCVAAAMLLKCSSAHAAQRNPGGRGGDPIAFIIQHAADLSLTDEQKNKLTEIQKENQKAMADARKGGAAGGGNREEYAAKRKEAEEKVAAVLSKDQQDKLATLKEKAAAEKDKKTN